MKNKQDKGKKIIRTGLEVNGENICRIEEAEGESDNKIYPEFRRERRQMTKYL